MTKTCYLTIDDGPSEYTPGYVDYLVQNNIPAVMFFIGEHVEPHRKEALYAIRNGIVIGNHSVTHPHFSKQSLEDGVREIAAMDELIDGLYREAGRPREGKLFRFPYGDKGGDNKSALQEFLKSRGYQRVAADGITYPWYRACGLDTDLDTLWTYDFGEFQLWSDAQERWTYEDVLNRFHEENPPLGGSLLNPDSEEIILIHDDARTVPYKSDYFTDLLTRAGSFGIRFEKPTMI